MMTSVHLRHMHKLACGTMCADMHEFFIMQALHMTEHCLMPGLALLAAGCLLRLMRCLPIFGAATGGRTCSAVLLVLCCMGLRTLVSWRQKFYCEV